MALAERWMAFGGKCAECGCKLGLGAGCEWDHRVPLEMGGEDEPDNLQPLCKGCHRAKTKKDVGHIAKGKRMNQREMGIKRQPKHVMPGSRAHHLQKKADGSVVDRRTGERIWPR